MNLGQNSPPQIGPYLLHDVIGRGATSTVWRGTDTQSGALVAVRFERCESFSEELKVAFESSLQQIASLDHIGIARVFSGGFTPHPDGKSAPGLYTAMELLEDGSAADLYLRGPVEPRRAVRIIREVCDAVSVANRHDILHLDVRPCNIMFSGETPKLTDFSSLRSPPGSNSELLSRALGTMGFSAPEQSQGVADDIDRRADVYGLCASLSALVTGSALGDDEVLSQVGSDWPDLVDLLEKGLAREPGKRFRSAYYLGLALDELLVVAGAAPTPPIEKREVSRALMGWVGLGLTALVITLLYLPTEPIPKAPMGSSTLASSALPQTSPPPSSTSEMESSNNPNRREFDLAQMESQLDRGDYLAASESWASLSARDHDALGDAGKTAHVRSQVGEWLSEYSYHPEDFESVANFIKGGSLGREIAELIRAAQIKQADLPYELEVLELLSKFQDPHKPVDRAKEMDLVSALSEGLEKYPERAELILTSAMYELRAGNASLAKQQLQKLHHGDRSWGRLTLNILSDLALEGDAVPPESFDGIVQHVAVLNADLGLSYLIQGDQDGLASALEALKKVTRDYPDMAAGHHNLAVAQARAGDLDGALQTLGAYVQRFGAASEWDTEWSIEGEFGQRDRVSASYGRPSAARLLRDPWLSAVRKHPNWEASVGEHLP